MRLYIQALNSNYPINGKSSDVIELVKTPTFWDLYEILGISPENCPRMVLEDREPVLKSLDDSVPVGIELMVSHRNPRKGVYSVTLMN